MTDEKLKDKARKRVSIVASYKELFSTPLGKKVLHDMINAHRMIRSTFSKDPMEMALREGERNVILRILTKMGTDPNELLKRIDEIEKEERD